MSVRFLHCADIHLGYEQYNLRERYNDFARSFQQTMQDALAERVDFCLLAGDLFHKRVIDPRTLLQACLILEPLREAGIPVYAVEGNHERPHYQDAFSWVDYLTEIGLLITLSPTYVDGRLCLEPWDPKEKQGAYVDRPDGVRIVGVKYYGASTARVLRDLAEALDGLPGKRPAYTVLMTHAGLQGILDNYSATLRRSDLDPLRPYVDYVALGHIHKPFTQDDWLYNPGSLETNGIDEAEWTDRGYFLVDVSSGAGVGHRVRVRQPERRPFVRLSFAVDRYESPEALYKALDAYLAAEARSGLVRRQPIVSLRLRGILPFDRLELDMARVERAGLAAFGALACLVRDETTPSAFEIRTTDTMTREELVEHVLVELVERDARHRPQSAQWARLILRLKGMALGASAPAEVEAELRRFRREAALEEAPC